VPAGLLRGCSSADGRLQEKWVMLRGLIIQNTRFSEFLRLSVARNRPARARAKLAARRHRKGSKEDKKLS
jgi:hypothetical protein